MENTDSVPEVPLEIIKEESFHEPGIPNSVPPENLVNFKLAPNEYLLQCPYERSHRILPGRMDQHLNRCRKNHAQQKQQVDGLSGRYRVCPHSPCHMIPEKEFSYHVAQCTSRYVVCERKKDFLKFIPNLEPHPELLDEHLEDWEDHRKKEQLPSSSRKK